VGDGFQPGVEVGPLINNATLHKVESLVQDAVAKGAQVAVGGQRLRTGALRNEWFYAPTVLLDVRDEMPVCQEEIFGPVAPVLTFRTDAELIARANATTFGLASYIYTQDYARILRLAEALEYGLVGVNDATGYTHEIPFGGCKESGLGREGGTRAWRSISKASRLCSICRHPKATAACKARARKQQGTRNQGGRRLTR
jgi:succinate-semialdehyde dehydrogenase/glutarate-semialdehyde dehydrogenase